MKPIYHPFRLGAVLLTVALVLLAAAALAPAASSAGYSAQEPPAADPCGPAALRITAELANVHAGPSEAYPAMSQVAAGDVLSIAGRHNTLRWWLVTLPDGGTGWVAEAAAVADGMVEEVSLVEAPPLEGVVLDDTAEPWVPVSSAPCEGTRTPAPERSSWTTPVNLSHSGAAGDHVMVTDSANVVHIIWRDSVAGFLYTRSLTDTTGLAADWAPPVLISPPFEAYVGAVPLLTADRDGGINAYWIGAFEVETDAETLVYENALMHSRVAADEFANDDAWSATEMLAEAALAAAAVVGSDNQIHLFYAGSPLESDVAGGVYYLRSGNRGIDWSEPAAIYQSAYLRPVVAESGNVRAVVTTVDGVEALVVAWDDRLLDKVFVTRSADAGQSWGAPQLVDARNSNDGSDAAGPANVLLGTRGSEVLLLWQAGHEAAACSQYFGRSADGGQTWTAPQRMLESYQACPESNQLLGSAGGQFSLLLAVLHSEPLLMAWDGLQWSGPQEQDDLVNFVNEETAQRVSLGCLQAQFVDAGRLLVVACTESGPADIWASTRLVEDVAAWFLPPSIWQPAEVVATIDGAITDYAFVADPSGNFHLFWVQAGLSDIQYARWNGNTWSTPSGLFGAQAGEPLNLAARATGDGRLALVWTSGDGLVYFSQATAEGAILGNQWAAPAAITQSGQGIGTVELAVDGGQALYAAYNVPLNEARGIYLTRSTDNGQTWSTPVTVFDGAAANWDIVGAPTLAASSGGRLYLMWSQQPLAGANATEPVLGLGLHYAASDDGGATFSAPEMVSDAPIRWSALVTPGGSAVHRLWQEHEAGATTFWHELSADDGATWQAADPLSTLNGVVDVQVDSAGQIHLGQAAGPEIQHWLWETDHWTAGEKLPLTAGASVEGVAIAVARVGRLGVAYAGSDESAGAAPQQGLAFSWRPYTLPPAQTATVAAPAPAASPTAEPSAIPSPTATAAPTRPPAGPRQGPAGPGGLLGSNDPIQGVLLSVVAAALVLGIVVIAVVGLKRVRGRS